MQKDSVILTIAAVVFCISLVMIVSGSITGHDVESTTTSNVTISKYLSIAMSDNLTNGITFYEIVTLPVVDDNATDNNNSGSGGTSLFVNVSEDSNVAVNICTKANADMTDPSSGYVIGLANESYLNSTTTDAATPGPATSGVSLTTSYVMASRSDGTPQGSPEYYRFWLDVPAGVASGTYNNTISFKGVENATSC